MERLPFQATLETPESPFETSFLRWSERRAIHQAGEDVAVRRYARRAFHAGPMPSVAS